MQIEVKIDTKKYLCSLNTNGLYEYRDKKETLLVDLKDEGVILILSYENNKTIVDLLNKNEIIVKSELGTLEFPLKSVEKSKINDILVIVYNIEGQTRKILIKYLGDK